MALKRVELWDDDDLQSVLQRDDHLSDKFWHSLDEESDRGMVLCAVAYFDHVLATCLINYFCECNEAKELLSAQNALGTYNSRIMCACALRIISAKEAAVLRKLGPIRNKFAHSLEADFSHGSVFDMVGDLAKAHYDLESCEGNLVDDLKEHVSCSTARERFSMIAFSQAHTQASLYRCGTPR